MRTKTLVLSGVVAALTSASVLAQVYSLNSVGYVNVTIPTGFSIIADQLYANGQGVAQYVSPLLDSQVLNGNLPGLTFYKFTAGTGANAGYFVFYVNPADTAWAADPSNPTVTGASEATLNPGEGIWVYNPNAAFTLTFVGTVPQGTLTVTMQPGFNIVSSVVPQTGAMDSVLGLTQKAGDAIYFFDSVTSWGEVVVQPGGTWETLASNALTPPNGTAPSAPIGGGFFYQVGGTSAETWSRTFTVN